MTAVLAFLLACLTVIPEEDKQALNEAPWSMARWSPQLHGPWSRV